MLDLQSVYFGQKHKDFDYRDFDLIKKVKRLALKHHRQCENSCNGSGYVFGQCYYNGTIDDYARRQYGQGVKSAYIGDSEETIFDKECSKIEEKITDCILIHNRLVNQESNAPFKVEYQGDPRGATVKLYYEGSYIDL